MSLDKHEYMRVPGTRRSFPRSVASKMRTSIIASNFRTLHHIFPSPSALSVLRDIPDSFSLTSLECVQYIEQHSMIKILVLLNNKR